MIIPTTNPINGRCCGKRQEESVYACCGASPWGRPIEHYIVDPARMWFSGFHRGVKIVPKRDDEVNDLYIIVGKSFYPSPWDYVEETRAYGASRKVIPTLPFDKLTPGKSNMVFVHSRAIPTFDYLCDRPAPLIHCHQHAEKGIQYQYDATIDRIAGLPISAGWHVDKSPCTFSLRDLTYVIGSKMVKVREDEKSFDVELPAFTYRGRVPIYSDDVNNLNDVVSWDVGVFLTLPLTHVEFCRKENVKVADKIRDAGFDVEILPY